MQQVEYILALAKVVIDYFKHRFVPQCWYSVNTTVWAWLTKSVEVAPNLSIHETHVRMLLALVPPLDFENPVWFSVTDARPERKAQVRTDHLARKTNAMVLTVFSTFCAI